MLARRDALRNYFIEVTKDLVRRGILRLQAGQSIEQLLIAEAPTVIREMRADFSAILEEMKVSAIHAVGNALFRLVGNFLNGGDRR